MTFYFYDLETSGFSCRNDRIMQFAGQRTTMDLEPVGEPDNTYVKLTQDILPEPGAVLVHSITPQKTLSEGMSEADFCKYLTSQVFTKDTIIVGYNNLRFDNDFIRFTFWRNFHDAYEWSWKDNRSTWDLLDVVRATRALRPEGINWPFASDGRPTNSLEYLTSVNKLDHIDAHDAKSDVLASIALAKLIRQKQPKLFDYLLNIRGKNRVAPLVTKGDPLVYTSGRYPSEFEKTTVVVMVAEKADKTGALVYDLRIDPDEFKNLTPAELAKRWKERGEDAPYFPVKELKYNRCPAVAPLSVLDTASARRLQIHKKVIDDHLEKLANSKGFGDKLLEALESMWPKKQPGMIVDEQSVDGALYDGFVSNSDRARMSVVRAARPSDVNDLRADFEDERLKALLPLYKARNFPDALTAQEKTAWQKFRRQKLLSGKSNQAERFFAQIEEVSKTSGIAKVEQLLLEEFKDYGQSITAAI